MQRARPYHHGNLRQAVLDEAATLVRERGAAELSLREIAAIIGVTHAAPRRYFDGRQELLDAVAVEGFARLGARLREATAEPDYPRQVRAAARAYLDFATAEANLTELMFAHKRGRGGEAVSLGAEAAFAPILEAFRRGEVDGVVPDGSAERHSLVFLATLQGLAGLINCGVIPIAQVGELVNDVVTRFQ